MSVTADTLRSRIQSEVYALLPQTRPYSDALSGALTAGDTSIPVTAGARWAEGDIVDFPDGDQAIVTAVTGDTLTVRREASATAHSSGDVITKNPRFSIRQIDYAVDDVLQDLYPRVWLIKTKTLTAANQDWYPIDDANLIEVLTVFYEEVNSLAPRAFSGWRQASQVPSVEFTETHGIEVPSLLGVPTGNSFYAVYRARITAVTELLDRQEPLVVKGAVSKLMNMANIARTADPARWTDRTVQPGQEGRDGINYLREYFQMLRNEELRLLAEEDRLPKARVAQRARRFRP